MPVALAALGAFSDILGIYSFFKDAQDDFARDFQIGRIRDALGDLQDVEDVVISSTLSQSLGGSRTALEKLDLYAGAEDAAERSRLAGEAVGDAIRGLNDVIEQVSANKGGASPDALMYMMGALQYAILARQTVANVVQDGPLGSPGLHQSVKEAAALMYDQTGRDDIISEFGRAFGEVIETDEAETNLIGTSVEVVVRSTFSGNTEVVRSTRDSGFRDQEVGIPPFTTTIKVPFVESVDDWSARVDSAIQAARQRIFNEDREAAGIETLFSNALEMNTWLALDAINVPGLYERIGDSTDNVEEGTNNADYFSGLQGDDILLGKNGPDALNGGSGNDILMGGQLQDFMRGAAGNDMIFGNEGILDAVDGDTARFAGLRSEYEILGGQTYATVNGPDGNRDKLFNIEFIRFDDAYFALDEGSALDGAGAPEDFDIPERVALIYEAALNRDGAIDLPGLNFYITVAARDNLTDEFIANDMMRSPEFVTNFGDPETLSNAEFLERIYLNVLDRTSDAAGRQFYLDLLNDQTITKALALADIAVSPENTTESTEVLMSLFEGSDGTWSFVTDGMDIV